MKATHRIFDFLHFDQPTAEQSTVLIAMQQFIAEENTDDYMILCGAAGTGKTSITSALIGLLNDEEKLYQVAAPTGRAARILGRKANTLASTIHSMIYLPKPDKDSGIINFVLRKNEETKPMVFIIDEASMIPSKVDRSNWQFKAPNSLLQDLIHYIKSGNKANKIIFMGDHYQLPPMKENNSNALVSAFLENTYKLQGQSYLMTEVKRQEDGSYILRNATATRKSIDAGKSKHPIEAVQNRNIYAATDKFSREFKSKGPENAVAIAVSHKANKFFNDLTRQRLFNRTKKLLVPGDMLMVTKNWRRNHNFLYNGDQLQLISVDWNSIEKVADLHFVPAKLRVLFCADEEKIIEDYILVDVLQAPAAKIDFRKENKLRQQRYAKNKRFRETTFPEHDRYVGALYLSYGYAITCNKAQGGEWEKVYINRMGIPSLRWQYTAVTRAVEVLEVF